MIILFIILTFIIGIHFGYSLVVDYIYSIHRINEEEYEHLSSFDGFIDILCKV